MPSTLTPEGACFRPVINYILTERPQFTVLIGSRARGNPRQHSDLDVIRIGHKRPVAARLRSLDKRATISYIDYSVEKFAKLYAKGSLFLYHAFDEGRLLEGNRREWNRLGERFKVQANFSEEISQNRKILKWLQRGNKAQGATIAYLAHTFRALKNLAIFSLAQRRKYIFDKREALRQAFPNLDAKAVDVLLDASDVFEHSAGRRFRNHIGAQDIAYVRKEVAQAMHRLPEHANH